MKIRAKKACWTPKPELNWSSGEVKEVSNEVGKKILINQNFSMVSDTKPEVKQKITKKLYE